MPQVSAETVCHSERENTFVSVFRKSPQATDAEVANAIAHFAILFPSMTPAFWALVTEAIKNEGWSIERLRYVYAKLRDTHHFATLTAADILSCDKGFKVYRHNETDGHSFIMLRGTDRWIHKTAYLSNPALFDIHPRMQWMADKWNKEIETFKQNKI